jgi:hypothetical protein
MIARTGAVPTYASIQGANVIGRSKTVIRYSSESTMREIYIYYFVRHRALCISAVMLILAIPNMTSGAAADGLSDADTARLTQMQIDALRTPYYSHTYLDTSPDESAFVKLVKEMTSVAINELKEEAVVMDLQAAEKIAKLIQNGASNIVAEGSSLVSITAAESKIKDFTKLILEHSDRVVAPRSAIMPKGGSELIEVHRNAFYMALRLFCPCYPFCE